ncbi:MAG: RluA family pseudouridine synthase [Campylobacter sp.]|nr:RluA family pseudouridine synthase [Campylobacter sp.]
MSKDKLYKVLAIQENISNNEAKSLVDKGLVFYKGKKVSIARALVDMDARFRIIKPQKLRIIFEDESVLAVDKPAFITCDELEKEFKLKLLHRLDKETSGVLVFAKTEEFRTKAIKEFKNLNVKKLYFAAVKGVVGESFEINEPILTSKNSGIATSKVDKNGKFAISMVEPYMVSGKKSLVKVSIKTGRTHQIRVHLAYAGFPVIGDEKYGKNSAKRVYLHSYEMEILGYKFKAKLSQDFKELGFEF